MLLLGSGTLIEYTGIRSNRSYFLGRGQNLLKYSIVVSAHNTFAYTGSRLWDSVRDIDRPPNGTQAGFWQRTGTTLELGPKSE